MFKAKPFTFFTLIFLINLFLSSTIFAQTPCEDGNADGFSCNNITLMASIPLSELGATTANDIWGWTSPNTNKEYAIIGLRNGYAFIDMTIPTAPVIVGKLPSSSGSSTWGDIKVDNNYAYLVSEATDHHIQVFDLLQLDGINNPPIIFDDSYYSLVNIGNGKAHNIVVDEESDFIYTVGTRNLCSGGPVAFDISDPANPVLKGCFSADGYSHDAMCFVYRGEDTEHVGKQICIGFNENTFTVVDVTNKRRPIELSKAGYQYVSYTHQGWMTDDHKYLLLNDEGDEQDEGVNTSTYIFDLSDLDNPVYVDTYFGNTSSIDHNLYVRGSYVYEGNYAEGLRIMDLSDVGNGNLNEVAYFDFYPAHNNAEFKSVWSSYPYFKSGNIPVSDYEEGFYIVSPNLPHFVMTVSNGPLQKICAGTDAVYEIDLSAYYGFTGTVDLEVSGLPDGATAVFSEDMTDADGGTTLTISNINDMGRYSLSLTASAAGSPDQNLALGLVVGGIVPEPTMILPLEGASQEMASPLLMWSESSPESTYDLEVAMDANFTEMFFTKNNIANTGEVLRGLQSNTKYFWKVRVSPTECQPASFWTPTNSFTTANIECVAVANNQPTNFPIGIPAGLPIVSTINVGSTGIISDLDISKLRMTHSNVGNLQATLASPSGTIVTLFDAPTCNQDNLSISFNDSAINDQDKFTTTCHHSDNGAGVPWIDYAIEDTYQAAEALSAFNGEEMQGTWILTIADIGAQDGGTLESWGMDICTSNGLVLDMDLIDFAAEAQSNSILVSWTTGNTTAIKNFELQRSLSVNGEFETIATMEVNNKEQFSYNDKNVKTGITYYYRLRQIDMAEKEDFSNIVSARLQATSSTVNLTPNPAQDLVQVIVNDVELSDVTISIMNVDGKLIKEEKGTFNHQVYTLGLKDLAEGIYLVKVQTESGVEVKRLVKQ